MTMQLGTILRARRRELGMSLAALAARVGAAKSYLSMIENRRVANPPSRPLLRALERALEIADGRLVRAADWQKTPAPVRREFNEAIDHAQRGLALAHWLKTATEPRRGGGKNLDKLFRTGELAQRIGAMLESAGEPEPSDAQPVVLRQLGPRVPLINKVAAGVPCEYTDLDMPVSVADEYIQCPGLDDPAAFAARITGESMQPDYTEGDIVIFSPAADIVDGSDCFVRLEPDHESTFKRIYFERAGSIAAADDHTHIRLQPLNPRFAPRTVSRESVTGLYRAVWRVHPL